MRYQYQQSPFGFAMSSLNFKERFRNFFREKSALNWLLIVNGGVFFLYVLLSLVLKVLSFLWNNSWNTDFDEQIVLLLACPASFKVALTQPWSYVTSLFLHTRFWHWFFNMLMLWVSGKLFKTYFDDKCLIITYLLGGVVGGLVYQAAYSVFPALASSASLARALGASGSIMALFAAIAVSKPSQQVRFFFLGGMKFIWIFVIFLAIDLLSIPKGNAGGHIAHLGGAAFGTLFALFYSLRLKSFKIFHFIHRNPKQKRKKYYVSQPSIHFTDEEYNARKRENERKTDEILDKISKFGYDALSKEEKRFLFEESKRKQ